MYSVLLLVFSLVNSSFASEIATPVLSRLMGIRSENELRLSLEKWESIEEKRMACQWERELNEIPCHCYGDAHFKTENLDQTCFATVQRYRDADELRLKIKACPASKACLGKLQEQVEIIEYQMQSAERPGDSIL